MVERLSRNGVQEEREPSGLHVHSRQRDVYRVSSSDGVVEVRRPKQHAREQRALLRLRRAAVRYSFASDDDEDEWRRTHCDIAMAFADLEAACDAYRTVIGMRDANRIAK